MRFSENQSGSRFIVTGYGAGFVTINGVEYRRSLILLPELIITDWEATVPGDLTPDRLVALQGHSLELVLLGTGPRLTFPPPQVSLWLQDMGIGSEIMSTGAACRTFNLLVGEGRRTAAALLPP